MPISCSPVDLLLIYTYFLPWFWIICFLVFFVNFYSVLDIVYEDILVNLRPQVLLLSSRDFLWLQAGNGQESRSAWCNLGVSRLDAGFQSVRIDLHLSLTPLL